MTSGLVREIISWVVPPVVGAVIGYVTNDIAIRMLFRPLKEIRLFGVRLPFTPGIFPKERRTLARSIGRMVSQELITEDALRRQVHSPRAQEALSQSVASISARILQSPLSSLSAAGSSVFASSLQELLHDMLRRFFASRALIYAVRDVVARAVASLSTRKVRDLLSRVDLKSFVTDRLLPRLAREETRVSIGRAAASAFTEQAAAIVSDELLASLSRAVEPLVPAAVDRLGAWLRSPDMRRELEVRGQELLSQILEKLNLMQRFLLSAGQFDRRLGEKMPEIVDDAIAALEALARDPSRQKQLLQVLEQAARAWRDSLEQPRRAAAGNSSHSGKGFAEGIAGLLDRFLAGLSAPEAREKVYAALEKGLFGEGDPSVGGFALRTLGIRDGEIVEYLAAQILQFLSRPETAERFSGELLGLAGRFLEEGGSVPVGQLLRIDEAKKQKLDAFLLVKTVELIDAKLPEVLRGVDVEQLVVEKIDGLEVQDVERLLLQVIATHLKWIDVFGAILGFVIGLFQNVLRLLRVG